MTPAQDQPTTWNTPMYGRYLEDHHSIRCTAPNPMQNGVIFGTMRRALILLLVGLMTTLAAGDTIFLKNGDQLTGQVTLEQDGKLSLKHGVLGPLQLDSSLIQGGELSLDLSDGSELSGTLVGYQNGAWLIKPEKKAVVDLEVGPDGGLSRKVDPVEAQSQMDLKAERDRAKSVAKEMKTAAEQRIKAAKKIVSDADEVLKNVWSGNFSIGGSMSRGTSTASNLSLNIGLKRDVGHSVTDIKAFYLLNTSDSKTTQNWFQASIDQTWNLPKTKGVWSLFGQGVFDWQQDASWEQRVNGNLGFQYQLVDAKRAPGTDWFEKMKIRTRVGPGFRKEFAGDNPDWAFEVLLGGTWDITFLKGVTYSGNAQIYPDITELGEFRVTSNSNFMVALDSMDGVSVGVGIKFQYQTEVSPGDEDFLLVVSGQVQYAF